LLVGQAAKRQVNNIKWNGGKGKNRFTLFLLPIFFDESSWNAKIYFFL
jgi:hypothetical protein